MISKVEAVNYRCLRAISQALGRFHVMAGANGSGKSTFLEVIRVLRAFAKYPSDLVVLVPDGAIRLVVQTLLTERRQSLGIREVRLELLMDPLHDASPESQIVMLLRGYLRTHERALVLRDLAGSGWEQRGALALRQALLKALKENGWSENRDALYRELVRFESLDGCVVPSFRQFVETLRGWFPSESG